MAKRTLPKLDDETASAEFVRRIAAVTSQRGEIAGNLTEVGTASILAHLQTGARYAHIIAQSANRLDVSDEIIETAKRVMLQTAKGVYADDTLDPDDDMDAEPYYLLGILVGIEIASGLRRVQ
jgi:hypothetical protein